MQLSTAPGAGPGFPCRLAPQTSRAGRIFSRLTFPMELQGWVPAVAGTAALWHGQPSPGSPGEGRSRTCVRQGSGCLRAAHTKAEELFSSRAGCVQPGAPRRTRSAHFHLPLQVNKHRLAGGAGGGRKRGCSSCQALPSPAEVAPPAPGKGSRGGSSPGSPCEGCPPGGRRCPG